MAELAPGLCVSEFVPAGNAVVFPPFRWLDGTTRPQTIGVNPVDWERIPGPLRERLLDALVRRSAEEGVAEIEAALAQLPPTPSSREEDRDAG